VQAVVPGGDALVAGDEVVGQLLVAVHVDEQVAAGLLHGLHHVVHLRTEHDEDRANAAVWSHDISRSAHVEMALLMANLIDPTPQTTRTKS